MKTIAASTLFLLVLVAPQLHAVDCTQPGNLVPNCGFVSDLSGWTFTADSGVHIAACGASTPGCLAVDRHDDLEALEVFSSCMLVNPSTEYAVGVSFRLSSGTFNRYCALNVLQYADVDCIDYHSTSTFEITPGNLWAVSLENLTTGAGVISAQLYVLCSSFDDFVLRLDDFWYGDVPPMLFADGFESGDTTAWNNTVGGP